MTITAEDCLRKAKHCERMARSTPSKAGRATYLAAAAEWRRKAVAIVLETLRKDYTQIENLREQDGIYFGRGTKKDGVSVDIRVDPEKSKIETKNS